MKVTREGAHRLGGPMLLMALLGGLQGCAFVDLSVKPPPAEAIAQPATLGRGREIVLALALEDERATKERCGMQKNNYNMDTASVHCTEPPAQWMARALAEGLTSAGFRVRTTPDAKRESLVKIDGALLQFFVEPKVGFFTFTPEADIAVKLVVTSVTGLRAERVFYVKGVEDSLVGVEDNFQKAADKATIQAVTTMVSAIASLLDRYPQVGVSLAVMPAGTALAFAGGMQP